MSDTDRRKKMISLRLSEAEYLRLSEAEYEALKTQYRTYGTHNISELARLALQRIMNGSAGPKDDIAAKVAELDERLRQLESHVSLRLEREKEMA
jgi:hypothetical protein